jgi:DNA-binding LacI/PurR family transcriptional regulator
MLETTPESVGLGARGGTSALVEDLREAIRLGRLREGQRLAPGRQLAREYRVSVATVNKAMAELEQAGLVERRPGSGVYAKRWPADETERSTVHLLMDSREHVFSHIATSVADALQDTPLSTPIEAFRRDLDFSQFDRLLETVHHRPPHAIVLQWRWPRLDQALARVCDSRTRVVMAMRLAQGVPGAWMSVQPDIPTGFRLIARHLVSLGHQRVGLVTHARRPHPEVPDARWKASAGHTQQILALGHALRDLGIHKRGLSVHYMVDIPYELGLPASYDWESAKQKAVDHTAQWLSRPDRPTAVVGHDASVSLAIRAAKKLGLRVPEDIAFVGLGNTPWADALDLTSLSNREDVIGRRIAELVTMDDARLLDTVHHLRVQPRLVVRTSCGSRQTTDLKGGAPQADSGM